MSPLERYDGRRLDRLINISDGITAVAITLLAVPLIGLALPQPGESFGAYLWHQAGPVIAFLFTFAIVFGQWRIHNRILSDLVGYDSAVFWINAAWLASIAFLPWPSALVGQDWESGRVLASGSGGPIALFYWLSLAVVVLMATAMRTYVLRHPDLVDPRHWQAWEAARKSWHWRSIILILGFTACGIAWFLSTIAGVICIIAVVVALGLVKARSRPQRSDGADAHGA